MIFRVYTVTSRSRLHPKIGFNVESLLLVGETVYTTQTIRLAAQTTQKGAFSFLLDS